LDSQPIEGSEHYEEAISGTKLHFTILGRIAKWKAARSKADTAMTCVLASFCCSPLAVVGLVLGILAIRDFKESVNQEGKGKALAAVAIGGGLILLCALMLIVAVIANLFK
jgi:hypothetical protein